VRYHGLRIELSLWLLGFRFGKGPLAQRGVALRQAGNFHRVKPLLLALPFQDLTGIPRMTPELA
jgi:hypothetical protein